MQRIYLTVTNDLTYDQRMIRICSSLSDAGYDVILVGRKLASSKRLHPKPFKQKRLKCYFTKGPAFYIEFNIRLFIYLLFKKADAICSIDLDTILPCYFISKIKGTIRIYDAHELFCEMKEIVERPRIYKIWKRIERMTVPHFMHGYTVNRPIAEEFMKMYGVSYKIIRSISVYEDQLLPAERDDIILYQGAVNEGRSFETLIPAMKHVNAQLVICGDGNFMDKCIELVKAYNVENKVKFIGMVAPQTLKEYTRSAKIGITLFEKNAKSNYYSLANRFFDYIHAGVPQLCVNYPVYREINYQYNIARLIDDLSQESITTVLNEMLNNGDTWLQLHRNCIEAAKELNWQIEEKKLIYFYKNILG